MLTPSQVIDLEGFFVLKVLLVPFSLLFLKPAFGSGCNFLISLWG